MGGEGTGGTDARRGLAPHLIGAFVDATDSFVALIRSDEVVGSWREPSVLEGYTVGGVAGHVLSLYRRLADSVVSAPPRGADLIPYTRWCGATPDTGVDNDALHRLLRTFGEAEAETGPAVVADALVSLTDDLRASLGEAAPEHPVPLTSVPNGAVVLNDYVRTRVVETVVHGDDIAASVGQTFATTNRAWGVALEVLVEASAHRHSPAEVMRTLARPARRTSEGLF